MSTTQELDAIDYVSEKLSTILLNNQELDFSKLRGLALLNGDKENREIYYELIILSFIKYLKLSSTFQIEIRQEVQAYKVFNSMNLNDDTINSHFIIFLSLVAPDIITSLCIITSKLASSLASNNSTKYTRDRLETLEARLNSLSIEGNKRGSVEFGIAPDVKVLSKSANVVQVSNRISLFDALVPEKKAQRKSRKSRYVRNKQASAVGSDSSISKGNYSLDRYINSVTLNSNSISRDIKNSKHEETASDTASRIFSDKFRVPIEPSDSASVVLPSRDQIKDAIRKYSIVDGNSSVDF
jgi:hypothetical protein